MQQHALRRIATLVAAPALVASAITLATTTSAQAAVPNGPTADGAAWLSSQVTDGAVHNNQYDFDDFGLSIDVALGLQGAGADNATVQAITDTIATNLTGYTSYFVAEGKTHVSAGGLAKALALAERAGRDGSDFGGQDVVTQLEDRVSTDSGTVGRIGDVYFPEEQFEADYANTLGQSFATYALDAAGSTKAADVTGYLLRQQCADGYFRLSFVGSATQDCADADTPNVDATALALINLKSQDDDIDVQAAVATATTWLAAKQQSDGGFTTDAADGGANANSTGLATWALGLYGKTAPAAKGATWVREHQLANAGTCTTYPAATVGAIAFDDQGLADAEDGIDAAEEDQYRRASAQALPALAYAPAAAPITASSATGFVRAGSTQKVTLSELTPGEAVCGVLGSKKLSGVASAAGTASFSFTLPAGTRTDSVKVSTVGASKTVAFKALAPKKLPFTLKATVGKGKQQIVKITGLAAGEHVTVKFRGVKVRAGKAGPGGTFVAAFKATGKVGAARVAVYGEFPVQRTNAKSFKVTR